jgi:thiamine pyrophosphate-dependent acetolactate synthase large subunit-like protein
MMQRYDLRKRSQTRMLWRLARAGGAGMVGRQTQRGTKTRTLGLVSSIAAGLAFALPHRKVIAIDGDGAFLMNLCGLPTIALQNPPNLIHLLFDNECYQASGGTPTASHVADAVALARGAGYKHATWVNSPAEFSNEFVQTWKRAELTMIAAKVEQGQPGNLLPLKLDNRKQVSLHALLGRDGKARHLSQA